MNRHDITEWIIHFIHKRNPENDPLEYLDDPDETDDILVPDSFTFDGKPLYLTERYHEDAYRISADADAIDVLKKILHDGIIKSGYSYRLSKKEELKPTIYGPKSAVCFTEMPLYALIEYSKSRSDENCVEPYGIAFLKDELFKAGARPVIYGLSGEYKESEPLDKYYNENWRALSSECGIGLGEMYRYVSTSLGTPKRIDWTHEREWRWADLQEKFSFAGLPFFAANTEIEFSKIIVLVKTNEEVQDIIEHIQHLYHSRMTSYEREYNLRTIANTYILSIEDLSKLDKDIKTIKFEDIPLWTIPQLPQIVVRPETIERVKSAIRIASEIANRESQKALDEKGDVGGAGWARVVTYVSNSEITQALMDLELATSYGTGCYYIDLDAPRLAQSLDVDESGKMKAAEYLTEELKQYFSIFCRDD